MTYCSKNESGIQDEESHSRSKLPDISQKARNFSYNQQTFPDFRECKEYICGWGAAFINITVTYPIYKVIFRQMLHGVGIRNACKQISSEGLLFLYRGILPPLCQKTLSLSLMFGLYEECREPLQQAKFSPVSSKTIAAIIAGSVEAIFMPLERVQTLLQDRRYHNRFKNTNDALKHIIFRYGVRECYRGLIPILLRNGPSNAMFFLLRDEAKATFPPSTTWYSEMSHEFISGAVIGSLTSTVFYPLNVVKVQMQCRIGGEYESVWDTFSKIYRERGLRSLYSGVHLNYTRAFISWGVINVAYGFLKKWMDSLEIFIN